MINHEKTERSFYHFSFLKDTRIHGIYLNSITKYLNLYPFTLNPHIHDFYTILIITGGNGSFKLCNDQIDFKPESVFMIGPNQMHSFKGLENAEGIIFFFCQDFYVEEFSFVRLLTVFSSTSVNGNNIGTPGIKLSKVEFVPLMGIMQNIENEHNSNMLSAKSAMVIRSFLNIMLLKISDYFEQKAGREEGNDSNFIHLLSNLIESYFTKEHKTGFYSSAFNITEKHLNDICQRNFRCGLKKILHDRLMQESRKLLLSTELSASEIAYKLNFEDNSYFNKVFKKSTGLTPKRFREMHKKLLP